MKKITLSITITLILFSCFLTPLFAQNLDEQYSRWLSDPPGVPLEASIITRLFMVILFLFILSFLDLAIQYLITRNKKMLKYILLLFSSSLIIYILMGFLGFRIDSILTYGVGSVPRGIAIYALINIPLVIYMYIKKMDRIKFQIVKIGLLFLFSFLVTFFANFFATCCL